MIKKPNIRLNIRITLVIFIALFAILAIFMIYSMSVYGETWFATPYNPRINAAKDSIEAGAVYDRNGTVLAESSGTDRSYNSDSTLRRSVSHVVGDEKGMTLGAETVFAKYLYGFSSGVIDKVTNALSGQQQLRGSDITLTIDSDLSRYAYENMDYNGAVVVMNYKTGEILASVSVPTFDPEDIEEGDSGTQFVNRVTMGRYPPGSTMKVLTCAAAVEAGIDFSYTCTGEEILDGQRITCVEEHGTQNLQQAFENSCNTYFAVLSEKLSASSLNKWANAALYNYEFNLSDITLYKSTFETSYSSGDNAWAAIGQYNDLVTPLHNCMIAAAVANDGVMVEPKLLKSVSGSSFEYSANTLTSLPSGVCETIKEYMRLTVAEGTATNAYMDNHTVCGKTGTAEYEENGEIKNHSWFIGFIAEDEHPLAIAVIQEGAGYGSKYATPLAKKVLSYALEAGY